ncbi:hypothetical protein GQ600_18494 [Phytophthora cactorum]|nr:hypothetical protein GQ600_18494 [Phytophthora cactorum]
MPLIFHLAPPSLQKLPGLRGILILMIYQLGKYSGATCALFLAHHSNTRKLLKPPYTTVGRKEDLVWIEFATIRPKDSAKPHPDVACNYSQPSSLSASPGMPACSGSNGDQVGRNYATQKKRKPGLVDSSSPSKRQRIGYEESSQMPSPTTEVSKAEEESFNVEIATVFFTVGIAFRVIDNPHMLEVH